MVLGSAQAVVEIDRYRFADSGCSAVEDAKVLPENGVVRHDTLQYMYNERAVVDTIWRAKEDK